MTANGRIRSQQVDITVLQNRISKNIMLYVYMAMNQNTFGR